MMNPMLEKIKQVHKKEISYRRILTTRMTIAGHKLFKANRTIHYAFILYRLKRDFGFTKLEIANFTGVTPRNIEMFFTALNPIMESELLKSLVRMNYDKEREEWLEQPRGKAGDKRPMGYWYMEEGKKIREKWAREPYFKLGLESETEYLLKLKSEIDEELKKRGVIK